MAHILNFDRQTQKYAVIERIGGGRWVERAQFAEMTDAGEYALWRSKHYGAIFAALGFETLVVHGDLDRGRRCWHQAVVQGPGTGTIGEGARRDPHQRMNGVPFNPDDTTRD